MFYLFMYDNYYPNGGLDDLKGRFETLEEALEKVVALYEHWGYDNYEIADSELNVVQSGSPVEVVVAKG